MRRKRVIIMGAGGRDIHNYLVYFCGNEEYDVVAFTAAQIPGLEFTRIPAEICGKPEGIPVYPEHMLPKLVKEFNVDEVVLAYSDLTFNELGEKISLVLASGASFRILGLRDTMLHSVKPVIAVTGVKTGVGKSTVSRAVARELVKRGFRVVAIRHPMAYGDIAKKLVIKIMCEKDLEVYGLTIEEREEFEPYTKLGIPVLAGVDYRKVLQEAERLGDVILWDGGNNDWPFIKPWFMIVVADALRPGLERSAYPGMVNVLLADAVIITKVSEAGKNAVSKIVENVKKMNKKAILVLADLEVKIDNPELVKGKKVVVVEDAPTVTHGGAPYAAGYVAAKKYGGIIVDPRPYAVGILKKVYEEYKHMAPVVPTVGYTEEQLQDLEETLKRVPADTVILATPARLEKLINISKPIVRVTYELVVREGPSIEEIIDMFIERIREQGYPL